MDHTGSASRRIVEKILQKLLGVLTRYSLKTIIAI